MVQGNFIEAAATIDAVEDLDVAPVVIERIDLGLQPVHEAAGLVSKADAEQRVQGEGGVADPGVTVVPVADTPQFFGQAASGRGDDGAGGLVGEQLQNEGGALDHLAPPTLVGALGEPVAPVGNGLLKQSGAFSLCGRMVVGGVVPHDADGESQGLPFVEHEGADDTAFVLFQEDIGG